MLGRLFLGMMPDQFLSMATSLCGLVVEKDGRCAAEERSCAWFIAVSDQRGTLVGMERRNDKLALKNPGHEKCFKKGGLRHSNLRYSRITAQPKSLYFSNDKGG